MSSGNSVCIERIFVRYIKRALYSWWYWFQWFEERTNKGNKSENSNWRIIWDIIGKYEEWNFFLLIKSKSNFRLWFEEIKDNEFIKKNLNDLCASLQKTIIEILVQKLVIATKKTGIKTVALAGGVAANSGLRKEILKVADTRKWDVYIPEFTYTTDNAAMIAIAGYFKYLKGIYTEKNIIPLARLPYERSVWSLLLPSWSVRSNNSSSFGATPRQPATTWSAHSR